MTQMIPLSSLYLIDSVSLYKISKRTSTRAAFIIQHEA